MGQTERRLRAVRLCGVWDAASVIPSVRNKELNVFRWRRQHGSIRHLDDRDSKISGSCLELAEVVPPAVEKSGALFYLFVVGFTERMRRVFQLALFMCEYLDGSHKEDRIANQPPLPTAAGSGSYFGSGAPWQTGVFGSVVRIVKSPKFAEFLPAYRGLERSAHSLPPAFSALGVVPPIPRAVGAAVVPPNQPATPIAGRGLVCCTHVRCPDVGDPECSARSTAQRRLRL